MRSYYSADSENMVLRKLPCWTSEGIGAFLIGNASLSMTQRRLLVRPDDESCPVHMESQVARKDLAGQSSLPISKPWAISIELVKPGCGAKQIQQSSLESLSLLDSSFWLL